MATIEITLKTYFKSLFSAQVYKHRHPHPFWVCIKHSTWPPTHLLLGGEKQCSSWGYFSLPHVVSHSSTCVVWFLDSTQALCNILMFQRCCVGETGTFKTDASNIESDPLVVAGGELGQMFPNLPQAVTHRWPPVPCAAAQGTTSSPRWVLHHGEIRSQIYELLARYSADGETFNLSFCEGIRKYL